VNLQRHYGYAAVFTRNGLNGAIAPNVAKCAKRSRTSPKLCYHHRVLNGPDDHRHGTINGYSNHKCRCDLCKAAWREYCFAKRQMRFSRGAKNPRTIPHGTTGGYGNWHCRCEDCTAAWAKDGRERIARKRQQQFNSSIDLINALSRR
jgi:hypothetical protein